MSKTLYVGYRDEGFWAYDVAVGIFLKYLIDAAQRETEATWLELCLEHWRVHAVISDLGLYLDEKWTDLQRQKVLELMEEACEEIGSRPSISADEMMGWEILDGQGVDPRGAARFPTEPVLELGHAVQSLLRENLPPAPENYWWFYGMPDGRRTIEKRG